MGIARQKDFMNPLGDKIRFNLLYEDSGVALISSSRDNEEFTDIPSPDFHTPGVFMRINLEHTKPDGMARLIAHHDLYTMGLDVSIHHIKHGQWCGHQVQRLPPYQSVRVICYRV